MKKYIPFVFIVFLVFTSCSTGKKALQKGDYFSAVSKSVQRLQSDPDNRKAVTVLKESYPLAIEWSQEEMDRILSLNEPFKWSGAVELMEQVNNMAAEIRQSPVARKIIPDPKTYTSELSMGRERAAIEQYDAGMEFMEKGTREAAREAYNHFSMAGRFIPGYSDVTEMLDEAKTTATLNVIMEAIPVHAQKYQLSSEFFYDQVFEFLNNKYPRESFVNFYSPGQAERIGLNSPDMVVKLEFYDFVVGQVEQSEKEEEVKRHVEVETRDTTRTTYKTYTAKLKTFSDKVNSGGVLDMKIFEAGTGKLLLSERIPGSFTWVNEYAMYVGDEEALDKKQLELTKRKVAPLPPGQDLFVEFTRPIYDQLSNKLNRFFRQYN